MKLVNITFHF